MSKKEKTYYNDDNMMEMPDVLKNVNKKSPFPVPDNYFESLPAKIQDRVFVREQKSVRKRTVLWATHRRIFIPVASLFLLLALFFVFKPDKSANNDLNFAGISLQETIDQYPEFFENIDEYTLIEVLISNAASFDDAAASLGSDSSITNDEIIDYLNDEYIDYEFMYNL